jgi:hypothetical protein
MGKSEETNLDVLKKKIENDLSYIDSVKAKVIEKLLSKVNLDDMTIKNSKITRKENEQMLIKNEHRLLKCQMNIEQKLQDIATINPALRDLVLSIHHDVEIILKITQKG